MAELAWGLRFLRLVAQGVIDRCDDDSKAVAKVGAHRATELPPRPARQPGSRDPFLRHDEPLGCDTEDR